MVIRTKPPVDAQGIEIDETAIYTPLDSHVHGASVVVIGERLRGSSGPVTAQPDLVRS